MKIEEKNWMTLNPTFYFVDAEVPKEEWKFNPSVVYEINQLMLSKVELEQDKQKRFPSAEVLISLVQISKLECLTIQFREDI